MESSRRAFGCLSAGSAGPRTVSTSAVNCRSPLKPAKLIASRRSVSSPSDKENSVTSFSSAPSASTKPGETCTPEGQRGDAGDGSTRTSHATITQCAPPTAPSSEAADPAVQVEQNSILSGVSSPRKHESIQLSPLPTPHGQAQAGATHVLLLHEEEERAQQGAHSGDESTASAVVPVQLCMVMEAASEPLLLYPDLDSSALAARVRQEGEVLHAWAQQLQEEATQACRLQGQSEVSIESSTPAVSPSTSLIGPPPPGTPPPYASPLSPLQALRARLKEAREGAEALAAEILLAQEQTRARLCSPYSSPLPPSPPTAAAVLVPQGRAGAQAAEGGEGQGQEEDSSARRFSLDSLLFHEALPVLGTVREALGSLLHATSTAHAPPLDASAISDIAQAEEESSGSDSSDDLHSLSSRGRAGSRATTPLARAAARAQSWGSDRSKGSKRATRAGSRREGRVSPAPAQVREAPTRRAPSPSSSAAATGKPPLLPPSTHAPAPAPVQPPLVMATAAQGGGVQLQGLSIEELVVQAAAAAAAAAVASLSSRPGTPAPCSRRESLSVVEACTQTSGGQAEAGAEGDMEVQGALLQEPASAQAVPVPTASSSMLFSSPKSMKKQAVFESSLAHSPVPMQAAAGAGGEEQEEDGVLDAIMTGTLALPTSPAEEAASALKASRRLLAGASGVHGGSPGTPMLDASMPWSPVSPPTVGYRGRGRTPVTPRTKGAEAELTWLAQVQQAQGEEDVMVSQREESRGMLSGLSAYTEAVPGGGPLWWLGDEEEEAGAARKAAAHMLSSAAAPRPMHARAPSVDMRGNRRGGARPWLPAGAYKHKDAHGLLTAIPTPIGTVPALSVKARGPEGNGRPLAGRSTR